MNEKISQTLSFYKEQLGRKENIIKPLRDKQGKFEDLTIQEEIKVTQLCTEIRMLKEFIEEMEYFMK